MNLRAQNLLTFIQLAEGVDSASWVFHLAETITPRGFENRLSQFL